MCDFNVVGGQSAAWLRSAPYRPRHGEWCVCDGELIAFGSVIEDEWPATRGHVFAIDDSGTELDFAHAVYLDDVEPLPSDFWSGGRGI